MQFDATREQWIERCAFRLAQLQPGAETDRYRETAHRLWARLGHLEPEAVAEAEHVAHEDEHGRTGSGQR